MRVVFQVSEKYCIMYEGGDSCVVCINLCFWGSTSVDEINDKSLGKAREKKNKKKQRMRKIIVGQ